MSEVIDRPQSDTSTAENWRERVLDGVGRRLDQMVASNEVNDFSGESERATVNAMADAVLATNRINDRLGAFYTTDRVRKVLGGVSRQAVSERVKNDRLLRVKTADGVFLFPAFQFANGAVVPGLQKLLEVLLGTGVDDWTVAYWLTARMAQLGETTALEVLASGDSDRIAELEKLAADDAVGWHAAA
ncbi:hypothetical protein QO003_001750 [Arthrobacter silviterrae]|uniref:PucR family transcriptional regulator n=1 Tax=Arthrobacter silviterrae TaxID=2026658 RepID=A0ABX0DM23_9MICC|nr:hypothetical protein [Arthrobacter silviterrae]MDQ0277447.1 hypothetical protein [Arthrobacter silviterrae]NGN85293.1 hypothetical protein [Arthrobacter silviterrae]